MVVQGRSWRCGYLADVGDLNFNRDHLPHRHIGDATFTGHLQLGDATFTHHLPCVSQNSKPIESQVLHCRSCLPLSQVLTIDPALLPLASYLDFSTGALAHRSIPVFHNILHI
ncbi:hypothetical protein L6452_34873 [Arctium lappa]|uniref:Uncharacterized protein n=1 Tax=Arctium lappa TaxID=4217 RepID=A0ACB8YJD0_ARCLA|nr:hypothetical protein L6452_34873 [Arctium lappa]